MKEVNTDTIHLYNILAVMRDKTFSKDEASSIVGGEKKLLRLIEEGKIQVLRTSTAQNSKWRCNASQVLKYCRDMR